MFRLIIILLLFTGANAYCFESAEYITLDKYISAHPAQRSIMERFSGVVSEKAEPAALRMQDPVNIAVIYPGIQKSNYWRDSVTSMEKRLDELGIRYDLHPYFSKPSGDYRLQVLQLSEAVRDHAQYIAISVDDENIKRLVTNLLAKDTPKIFIQNLTTPLPIWEKNPPFMYVGFDHTEGAKMIADQYAKMFPRGAKYLMLYGSKGSVSTLRGDGFESYGLTKGFVAEAKFYTDFSSDRAYEAVKESLAKHPDISFIYTCSTDIAIGASKALEEMGLTGKIPVNGWGGTLNELELIKQKKLDFTVMRMNDDNGVAIAEAIKLDILKKADSVPHIFSGEFVTVTKDMSPDYIDKLTERALRYSAK